MGNRLFVGLEQRGDSKIYDLKIKKIIEGTNGKEFTVMGKMKRSRLKLRWNGVVRNNRKEKG